MRIGRNEDVPHSRIMRAASLFRATTGGGAVFVFKIAFARILGYQKA